MKTLDLTAVAAVRHLVLTGAAKAIRERARVSLGEIALVVGVTPQAVHRWESGKALPRPAQALKYKEVLDALEENMLDQEIGIADVIA